MTETKLRLCLCRSDGVYVNYRYEPVKQLSQAARFTSLEQLEAFLNGYYAPNHPEQYEAKWIEITYREVANGEHGYLREGTERTERSH